ncbi:hypothetical protein [Bifidobacterium sp. UBA744]|nr:hypothetical protein [Bifidobacterium sp. UBA744]
MSQEQQERRGRQERRRAIARVVCLVVAIALLGSLVVPVVVTGL